jgi:two-component system KDP operon response regulator KdpE
MNDDALILIVEDDNNICNFISEILTSYSYSTIVANNAADAIAAVERDAPDLVLLDLGLPDMDGTEAIRRIRKMSVNLPIIVVSAREESRDKVTALDLGADDYITKPFDISEFLARIRVALTRFNHMLSEIRTASFLKGEVVIDFDKHLIIRDGEEIRLTQNEFKIIELLSQNAGKAISHEDIINSVWGANITGDNKILRVNITNIRKKVEANPNEPKLIHTVFGVGYRMTEPD